ncbi:hypothetical protein C8Q80DRAFT_459030 [Daedaleopsis nitida]|nr:hypothetical protein C8Q80DRAFT_459030 [Daedaleopsis nitida]
MYSKCRPLSSSFSSHHASRLLHRPPSESGSSKYLGYLTTPAIRHIQATEGRQSTNRPSHYHHHRQAFGSPRPSAGDALLQTIREEFLEFTPRNNFDTLFLGGVSYDG